MVPYKLKDYDESASEQGSALVYILIAIALLAALTFTFMEPSSQQTTSQNTFKTAAGVETQVEMIRSAIQECVLSYSEGDVCINDNTAESYCNNPAGTSDSGASRIHYPINPNSTHYTNASPGQSGDRLVKNLRCPGNNGGENANHDNHELIFSASSGKFMPPAPDLFTDWQYYHGADGIFFWTTTDKTDAFITSALDKIDDKYHECEADVITGGGSGVDLDSGSTLTCAANNVCFRVWMIMENDTAVFNGDTDTDETVTTDCSSAD